MAFEQNTMQLSGFHTLISAFSLQSLQANFVMAYSGWSEDQRFPKIPIGQWSVNSDYDMAGNPVYCGWINDRYANDPPLDLDPGEEAPDRRTYMKVRMTDYPLDEPTQFPVCDSATNHLAMWDESFRPQDNYVWDLHNYYSNVSVEVSPDWGENWYVLQTFSTQGWMGGVMFNFAGIGSEGWSTHMEWNNGTIGSPKPGANEGDPEDYLLGCTDGRIILLGCDVSQRHLGVMDFHRTETAPGEYRSVFAPDLPALAAPVGWPQTDGKVFFTEATEIVQVGPNEFVWTVFAHMHVDKDLLSPQIYEVFTAGLNDRALAGTAFGWVKPGGQKSASNVAFINHGAYRGSITYTVDGEEYSSLYHSIMVPRMVEIVQSGVDSMAAKLATEGVATDAPSNTHTSAYVNDEVVVYTNSQGWRVGVTFVVKGSLPTGPFPSDGVLRASSVQTAIWSGGIHFHIGAPTTLGVYPAYASGPLTGRTYPVANPNINNACGNSLVTPERLLGYLGGGVILAKAGYWEGQPGTQSQDFYRGGGPSGGTVTYDIPDRNTITDFNAEGWAVGAGYGSDWRIIDNPSAVPCPNNGDEIAFCGSRAYYSAGTTIYEISPGGVNAIYPIGHDGFTLGDNVTMIRGTAPGEALGVCQYDYDPNQEITLDILFSNATTGLIGNDYNEITEIVTIYNDQIPPELWSYEDSATTSGWLNHTITLGTGNELPTYPIYMKVVVKRAAVGKKMFVLGGYGGTLYDAGWVPNSFTYAKDDSLFIPTHYGGNLSEIDPDEVNWPIQVIGPLKMITTQADVTLVPIKTNEPYNFTMLADQGIKPYVWSITSGSLPDGITLDADTGIISGTTDISPGGSPWNYDVEITVVDADSPQGNISRNFSFWLEDPYGADVELLYTIMPTGYIGQDYLHMFGVQGGKPPYTFTIGGLPSSLTYDTATGMVSGTIDDDTELLGDHTITVQVSDSSDTPKTDEDLNVNLTVTT